MSTTSPAPAPSPALSFLASSRCRSCTLIHVAFGVLGLLAARSFSAARLFLVGGGVIYLVLTLYGAVIDYSSDANFVPVNTADNWLHLALGLGMIVVGVGARRSAPREDRPTSDLHVGILFDSYSGDLIAFPARGHSGAAGDESGEVRRLATRSWWAGGRAHGWRRAHL